MASAQDFNHGAPIFRTTHWSVVLAARGLGEPDAHSALTRLCQTYWYPLYCCVRRHGYSPEDAQDFTQSFFAKLLAKNQIALADPKRGRFRTFLLHSLENFLRSEHRNASAQKRGGGRAILSLDAETAEDRYATEPSDQLSPVSFFEKQWAGAVLESVLAALRAEFSLSGRMELFESLEPHLWGDDTSTAYLEIGAGLQMTEGAVRVTLHRLRRRFHDLLRAEIANTVGDPTEVDDELSHLRRALAS